ncbi:epoxyqueuosine reductase [Chloroflexota bacterium]
MHLSQNDAVLLVGTAIKDFIINSPLNCLTSLDNEIIFDEPLVQFADGDDPIFTEYKSIIDTSYLTPREVMAKTADFSQGSTAEHISVISWILPISSKTRMSNRQRKLTPSRLWANTRWYGEKFNEALREHIVEIINKAGHLAIAPALMPYFNGNGSNHKGRFSNWSERHTAYAAGLGTFSLSDGFITECGIAHRCGSVVTDLSLPAHPREASGPYSNCLFYEGIQCRACINRCPAGAITEEGHDKAKCQEYLREKLDATDKKYNVGYGGCGLCQTKVPCESRNPMRPLNKRKG